MHDDDTRPASPDLRRSAVQGLDREWADSITAGRELARVFERLLAQQNTCHQHGLHTTIDFADDPLTQRAWDVFQDMNGNMVPPRPGEPPPAMRTEDEIVARVVD